MSILINSLKRTGGISPELIFGITVLKSLINDFNRSIFSSNRICFCFLAIYLEEISNLMILSLIVTLKISASELDICCFIMQGLQYLGSICLISDIDL